MSSVRPFPSLSTKPATAAPGLSCSKVLEFPKRRKVAVGPTAFEAAGWWSDLIRAVYADRESCRDEMGVAFQTACNWWDGVTSPQAAHMLRAAECWPGQLSAALAEWPKGRRISGRRAA